MPYSEKSSINSAGMVFILILILCCTYLFFKQSLNQPVQCLSCNAKGVQPAEGVVLVILGGGATLGALHGFRPKGAGNAEVAGTLSLLWSAALGAVQNFIPLTPPTVAGPGVVDTALYLNKIRTAGSPEEANRAAATEIWDLLLPGLGDKMKPATESLLDLGKKDD